MSDTNTIKQKPQSTSTIVCGRLPPELLTRMPYVDPDDPDYIELYTYADLDALFELHGHIRACNPASEVRRHTAKELEPDDLTTHLVLLGGGDWNDVTTDVIYQLGLPVKQVNDWDGEAGAYFSAGTERYGPRLSGGQLHEDVALFYRGPNPFNRKRTLTICNGMYGCGTLGVVRALTDSRFRDRNAEFLLRRFGDQGSYAILSRISVLSRCARACQQHLPAADQQDVHVDDRPEPLGGRPRHRLRAGRFGHSLPIGLLGQRAGHSRVTVVCHGPPVWPTWRHGREGKPLGMPEGHLIHRYAREQHRALAGRVVRAGSPQGRFDARPYDGRLVEGVEAVGKHLLYHFDGGPAIHVHLGMRGLFLRYDDPAAEPRGGTRLRLATDEVAFDLIAPSRCETMGGEQVAALRACLGPDPLRGDAERGEAVRRLAARRGPVGAAVLDQGVWAGIGNAWRAELLFLAGLDPDARNVGVEAAGRLWDLAVRHLALGQDAGQVVSDPAAPDERWVYKRETCRRCGTAVRTWPLAGRTAYACPHDQPTELERPARRPVSDQPRALEDPGETWPGGRGASAGPARPGRRSAGGCSS